MEIDITIWTDDQVKAHNKNPLTTVKICRTCRIELNTENWSINLNTTGRPHDSYWCNTCMLDYQRTNRAKKRARVLNEYGAWCACCGLTQYDILDIDHIHNDGYIERKTIPNIVDHIIKNNFPKDRYQILCKNCNRIKAMRKGLPCNCKEPESNILSPQKFERPKKYLNIKFQPFETKKCTDCHVSLNDQNYRPQTKGKSMKYICNDCRSNRNAQYALKRRQKVLEAYGCKCNQCGYDKHLALEIDHVFNDGKEERKEKKIKDFYRFLITNNYPQDRYQLLCANCNYLKQKSLKAAK